jgi:hypothetical protein
MLQAVLKQCSEQCLSTPIFDEDCLRLTQAYGAVSRFSASLAAIEALCDLGGGPAPAR